MKSLLIFPPGWDPTQPYLSLPTLKGYVSKHGHDIDLLDLNVEFYDYLTSINYIKRLKEKLKNNRTDKYDKELLPIIDQLIKNINSAKNTIRSDLFYSITNRTSALSVIELSLMLNSYVYPNVDISLNKIDIFGNKVDDNIISRISNGTLQTPFQSWYKNRLYQYLKCNNPKLIGISLISYQQLIPTIILLKSLREIFDGTFIVLGGDIATRLSNTLLNNSFTSTMIDAITTSDGEYSLKALLDKIKFGTNNIEKILIPNLSFLDDSGRIIKSNISSVTDITRLGPPDFSGLPLDKYFAPKIVFPIESSRGCYWNKCSFCEEVGKKYRIKDDNQIIDEIVHLIKTYKSNYISFSDSCVPPKTISKVSNRIINENIKVYWRALLRPEDYFSIDICQKASDAGCTMVMVGIESGSQVISDTISKGLHLDKVSCIINHFNKAEIWVHCYFMYGLPTETLSDLNKTIHFIKNNYDSIDSVCFSEFVACKDTEIYNKPNRFGISFKTTNENPWYTHRIDIKGKVFTQLEKIKVLKKLDSVLDYLNTDVDKWIMLHINHLFLTMTAANKSQMLKDDIINSFPK